MLPAADNVALLNWRGNDYELRYEFALIRRLRADGVDVPKLYRLITGNPGGATDLADEIAALLSALLRYAGAKDATPEAVWRWTLTSSECTAEAFKVFYWLVGQHYAQPDNLPAGDAAGKTTGALPPT